VNRQLLDIVEITEGLKFSKELQTKLDETLAERHQPGKYLFITAEENTSNSLTDFAEVYLEKCALVIIKLGGQRLTPKRIAGYFRMSNLETQAISSSTPKEFLTNISAVLEDFALREDQEMDKVPVKNGKPLLYWRYSGNNTKGTPTYSVRDDGKYSASIYLINQLWREYRRKEKRLCTE
jgi:hypothetical protein